MDFDLENCEQPTEVNFSMADGVFVKASLFEKKNTVVPQHSHTYDHTSFIASGEVDVWVDGKFMGNFRAPAAIMIEANKRHMFMTLQDFTQILCIHNIGRNGEVEIAEEHQLQFPKTGE